MPTKYESKKTQIMDFFEKQVIPVIKQEKDLDYYKIVQGLSTQFGVNKKMIEEILQHYIDSGKICECRVLTIPEKEIGDWLKNLKAKEDDFKKADKILKELEESAIKIGDKK